MGYQHALGGAAAWLAVSPVVGATVGLTPGQVALGAVMSGAGGLVPDLDQHGSTIARTYGPVTNVVARLVSVVSGGHRNGTHSILGVAAAGILTWVCLVPAGFVFPVLWVLLGIGVRGLTLGSRPPRRRPLTALLNAVAMAAVAGFILATGVPLVVPVVAGVVVGAASHVALDMLTPQRCPLLWPVSKARHGVPLVTTGSRWSSPVVTGLLTVAVACSAWVALVAA